MGAGVHVDFKNCWIWMLLYVCTPVYTSVLVSAHNDKKCSLEASNHSRVPLCGMSKAGLCSSLHNASCTICAFCTVALLKKTVDSTKAGIAIGLIVEIPIPQHAGALCLMLSSAVEVPCLGLMLSLNVHNDILYNQRFGVRFWYTFFSGGTTTSVVPLCQASVASR